jgi:mannose/cellobiose epimerase-like protein (N-acyl-D-glucosamine 2-epimerase family)
MAASRDFREPPGLKSRMKETAPPTLTEGPYSGKLMEWMIGSALPLWAESGWDPKAETFVERLDFDGRAHADTPRRVMVQARQIFVYSVAHRRGWRSDAKELVLRATSKMISRYFEVDGQGGWAFSADARGAVVDSRRDLYAQAFALLGLANAYSVDPNPLYLRSAEKTLAFLDKRMAAANGGYAESLPASDGPRRQNPHMHLFEALLALHTVAPSNPLFLDKAAQICGLFFERFLQRDGAILAEYFQSDWRPAGADLSFEPGHHFEWVWLLAWYERFSSAQQKILLIDARDKLWRNAHRLGVSDDGVIFGQVGADGRIIDKSSRLWSYAEAAKAAHFAARRSLVSPDASVRFGDLLHDRFLTSRTPGIWVDHLDEMGRAKVDFVPASSLYHICCCLDVIAAENASRDGGG